jgi:hypothetical protein
MTRWLPPGILWIGSQWVDRYVMRKKSTNGITTFRLARTAALLGLTAMQFTACSQPHDFEVQSVDHAQSAHNDRPRAALEHRDVDRPKEDAAIYRINCGGKEVVDALGRTWVADREVPAGGGWGACGGNAVLRTEETPIASEVMPEVLRSERVNVDNYVLPVPSGSYEVAVICAETHCASAQPTRAFDINVQGRLVAREFCPYEVGGGFARAAVVRTQIALDKAGDILVSFNGRRPIVNGLVVTPVQDTTTHDGVASLESIPRYEPPSVDRAGRQTVRVLFIGNSGTFYWDIPQTVAAFVNRGQDRFYVEAEALTSGGKTFRWHYEQPAVLEHLRNGEFDYVVLQDGSKGVIDRHEEMDEFGGELIEAVRASGAEPILFAYYGPRDAPVENWQLAAERYLALGAKHKVAVVPAAMVLRKLIEAHPAHNFHDADRHHSGPHAAYAFACAFYSVLTGQSPEGHPWPAVLGDQAPIEARWADTIATAAQQVAEELGDDCRVTRGSMWK